MTDLLSRRGSWLSSLEGASRMPFRERSKPIDSQTKLLIAGVVIVGMGWLAWTYLGPDTKRYLKIRSM
jgi:hypothetical protein